MKREIASNNRYQQLDDLESLLEDGCFNRQDLLLNVEEINNGETTTSTSKFPLYTCCLYELADQERI